MNLKASYFALPDPVAVIEHWLNPEAYEHILTLRGKPLRISWTRRAERQLRKQSQPLLAEMQLYFSCVVKKRVLFHPSAGEEKLQWLVVDDRIKVAFRAVQANSCDPVEFAAHFPVKGEFETLAAVKMHPSHLHLDYQGGQWRGDFTV